jgi:hypothetical protein
VIQEPRDALAWDLWVNSLSKESWCQVYEHLVHLIDHADPTATRYAQGVLNRVIERHEALRAAAYAAGEGRSPAKKEKWDEQVLAEAGLGPLSPASTDLDNESTTANCKQNQQRIAWRNTYQQIGNDEPAGSAPTTLSNTSRSIPSTPPASSNLPAQPDSRHTFIADIPVESGEINTQNFTPDALHVLEKLEDYIRGTDLSLEQGILIPESLRTGHVMLGINSLGEPGVRLPEIERVIRYAARLWPQQLAARDFEVGVNPTRLTISPRATTAFDQRLTFRPNSLRPLTAANPIRDSANTQLNVSLSTLNSAPSVSPPNAARILGHDITNTFSNTTPAVSVYTTFVQEDPMQEDAAMEDIDEDADADGDLDEDYDELESLSDMDHSLHGSLPTPQSTPVDSKESSLASNASVIASDTSVAPSTPLSQVQEATHALNPTPNLESTLNEAFTGFRSRTSSNSSKTSNVPTEPDENDAPSEPTAPLSQHPDLSALRASTLTLEDKTNGVKLFLRPGERDLIRVRLQRVLDESSKLIEDRIQDRFQFPEMPGTSAIIGNEKMNRIAHRDWTLIINPVTLRYISPDIENFNDYIKVHHIDWRPLQRYDKHLMNRAFYRYHGKVGELRSIRSTFLHLLGIFQYICFRYDWELIPDKVRGYFHPLRRHGHPLLADFEVAYFAGAASMFRKHLELELAELLERILDCIFPEALGLRLLFPPAYCINLQLSEETVPNDNHTVPPEYFTYSVHRAESVAGTPVETPDDSDSERRAKRRKSGEGEVGGDNGEPTIPITTTKTYRTNA